MGDTQFIKCGSKSPVIEEIHQIMKQTFDNFTDPTTHLPNPDLLMNKTTFIETESISQIEENYQKKFGQYKIEELLTRINQRSQERIEKNQLMKAISTTQADLMGDEIRKREKQERKTPQ